MSVTTPPDERAETDEHHNYWTLRALDTAQREYLAARQNRLSAIRGARASDLTCAAIAQRVGMTEGGVRMLLKRAGDA